jgi:hypothetical protein
MLEISIYVRRVAKVEPKLGVFMMNDTPIEERLDEVLTKALRAGKGEIFTEYAHELEIYLLEAEVFPTRLFESLTAILQRRDFQVLEGSWKLIKVFENNWELLSDSQQNQLLVALEEAYPHFTDWMACFMISEILSQLYKDDRALQALKRLRRSTGDMQRSLIPHGLEHLALEARNENVAREAGKELVIMGSDPAENVRDEVARSLGRLKKQRMLHPE